MLYIYLDTECVKWSARIFASLNSYLGAPPKARFFLIQAVWGCKTKVCVCVLKEIQESGRIKAHHNKNRGGKIPLKV